MTKPELLSLCKKLRTLLESSTPGEWVDYETCVSSKSGLVADLHCDAMGHSLKEREANTTLIVKMHNNLATLLDAIEKNS